LNNNLKIGKGEKEEEEEEKEEGSIQERGIHQLER